MSNIVIDPSSGILEFNTGSANGSSFDNSLLGASRLEFQNSGQLALTSLSTGVSEKFTVDGPNGRLFTVGSVRSMRPSPSVMRWHPIGPSG